MAKVRTETEKKSFAAKWFYPLRVKVPVQIFAAIFIVVAAVYVYRAGNEQFKEVMPPTAAAPMMEEQSPVKKDLPAKEREITANRDAAADIACEGNACKIEEPVLYDRAEESAKGTSETPASPAPVQTKDKNLAAGTVEVKSQTLRTSMEKSAATVGLKRENNVVIIRTSEVKSAAARVEKMLAECRAEKVTKQSTSGEVVFRAEISKDKLNDFIVKLETIGAMEDKVSVDIDAATQMSVVIKIRKN